MKTEMWLKKKGRQVPGDLQRNMVMKACEFVGESSDIVCGCTQQERV